MIRLAETIDALRPLCGSAFGCQILSSALAYGLSRPFAQFWTDGAAAYGMLDGVMRIAGAVEDPEEARSFLGAVGAAQVVCSAENGARLGLRAAARGAVLEKDLAGAPAPAEPAPVRAVYEVLAANGMAGDFEPFYLDLSHRLRHGAARASVLYAGGEAVAAAAAALAGETALVTAVAVLPAEQGKGYGGAVLRAVEAQLGGCRAYLLRAEHENERFYARRGYVQSGAWCAGVLE